MIPKIISWLKQLGDEILTWWRRSGMAKRIRWFVYNSAVVILDLAEYSPRPLLADTAKLLRNWLKDHPPD